MARFQLTNDKSLKNLGDGIVEAARQEIVARDTGNAEGKGTAEDAIKAMMAPLESGLTFADTQGNELAEFVFHYDRVELDDAGEPIRRQLHIVIPDLTGKGMSPEGLPSLDDIAREAFGWVVIMGCHS